MNETTASISEMAAVDIIGSISHIFYTAADTGFMAGEILDEKDHRKVRFTGIFHPPLKIGQRWHLEGNWEKHLKYGLQVHVQAATLTPKQPHELLVGFFSSNIFSKINKKIAQKITDTLGEEAISKIIENPDVLVTQCKLTEEQMQEVQDGLKKLHLSGKVLNHFLEWGLNTRQINTLSRFGQKEPQKFKRLGSDPFYPYYFVSGFGYGGALRLADGLGLRDDDIRRQEAIVFQALSASSLQRGSTFITFEELQRYLTLPWTKVQQCLELLQKNRRLITVEQNRIYLRTQYEAEISIAQLLYSHVFPVAPLADSTFQKALEQAEKEQAISYDDSQKKAIETFFSSSIMILNGGPGTGKSTLLMGILRILSLVFPSRKISLCAPTGRAAKRMEELTHYPARTIHSLLKWNADDDTFMNSEPLDCDYLIVDEFSMVDCRLCAHLLENLKDSCRILIIGDEEQLESVGPGNVLSDLIQSQKIPVANLQTLHRQKVGSGIPILAHSIRHEEPLSFCDPVQFIEISEPSEIFKGIEPFLEREERLDDVQILAPMYDGPSGIDEINAFIQEKINPFGLNKPQITKPNSRAKAIRKYVYFREGDKVLLTQNMPNAKVFNGDMGYITEIDPIKKTIQVDFGQTDPFTGKPTFVEFDAETYDSLKHAWCISVHKSQGSEYQQVCFIADQNGQPMLHKRLIYTGISRAKKQLTIFGSKTIFKQGVKTISANSRHTTLRERLDRVWESGGLVATLE